MTLLYFKPQFAVLLSALILGVSAVDLHSIKNWRSYPAGITCTKEGGTLKFNSGDDHKQMYPLCRIPAGSFKKVRALRFDIMYQSQATEEKFIPEVLLYSKKLKKLVHFKFHVESPGVWQTVTVKLEHPDVNMAELQNWQFSFYSRQPNLIVLVKNLRCLGKGKEESVAPGGKNLKAGVSTVYLQTIKNWRSFPAGITCAKEGVALKFDSGDNDQHMYPLCHIPVGSFKNVRALQFDIKYQSQAAEDKFIPQVLLYSKKLKKLVHFKFQVKSPDVWQTVTVKLEHPDVNMAELQNWQFSFYSRQPNLIVLVKNLRCLDDAGKEVELRSGNNKGKGE